MTGLSGGAGYVVIGLGQGAGDKLPESITRPSPGLEGDGSCKRNIDDDFALSRALARFDLVQIGAASGPNVASDVQEADGRNECLASVTVPVEENRRRLPRYRSERSGDHRACLLQRLPAQCNQRSG